MIEIHNRRLNDINGVLNLTTCLFGLKFMCRMKSVLGIVRGRRFKKEKISEINSYYNKGMPNIPKLSQIDRDAWRYAFRELMKRSNDTLHWNMVFEFYNADMEMVKDFDGGLVGISSDVAVLCVERNEILRIREFIEHYRSIGVERFLILDNESNDGTREYLMAQPDVRLYSTPTQYNAQRKSAWQNRMVAEYGMNKWYIYVDADEFFWYPHASQMSITEYVRLLENKGVMGVKAIMLEMYPKGVIGSDEYGKADFLEQYKYFDGNSDYYSYDPDTNQVYGGMITRVLHQGSFLRTKTPLYFHTKDRFLVGSHHIYPLYDDIDFPFGGLLRHYKFLPGDEDKVREAVAKGNYANNSMMYKKYARFFDDEEGISAYCELSKEWTDDATEEFEILKDFTT